MFAVIIGLAIVFGILLSDIVAVFFLGRGRAMDLPVSSPAPIGASPCYAPPSLICCSPPWLAGFGFGDL